MRGSVVLAALAVLFLSIFGCSQTSGDNSSLSGTSTPNSAISGSWTPTSVQPKEAVVEATTARGVTLLVSNIDSADGFEALLSGRLGVNISGCVVLGDAALLIAPPGSEVRPEGSRIFIPGKGDFQLGEMAELGSGGFEELSVTALPASTRECVPTSDQSVRVAVVSPF